MCQVEIHIRGQLAQDWADWIGGLSITHDERGETTLAGTVPDQAALRGVLDKLADLGLELISMATTSEELPSAITYR